MLERGSFLQSIVNREKTKIADKGKIKFLGYGFYYSRKGVRATVHAKSKAKLEKKIKEITRRSDGRGYEWKKRKLAQTLKGWVNYFKLADMKSYLARVDEWKRTRLRMFIWKSWKTIGNKYRNLRKCGTDRKNAIIFPWILDVFKWQGSSYKYLKIF